MTTDPPFSIPAHPQRRFPHGSGVEYEGGTEFRLIPDRERSMPELAETVVDILEAGPYRYGDFHDLPMPLWLVRDEETTDVFRVASATGRSDCTSCRPQSPTGYSGSSSGYVRPARESRGPCNDTLTGGSRAAGVVQTQNRLTHLSPCLGHDRLSRSRTRGHIIDSG